MPEIITTQPDWTTAPDAATYKTNLDTAILELDAEAGAAREKLDGLGTAAYLDVGTAPGNVVQLDASGRLPAMDASLLTGLTVSQISGLAGVPAGVVFPWPAAALPAGYARCNGAEVDRAVWAKLFAVIGTTYGAGDGSTTFNLPDFRGVVLRGLDRGRGLRGPTLFNVYQADAFQGHWHGSTSSSGGPTNTTGNAFYHMSAPGIMGGLILASYFDAGHGDPRADYETRGKAYGVDWIIKA